MNIPFELIRTQNPAHLRNYLHTFGYMVIENFFSVEKIKIFNEIWDANYQRLAQENDSNTPTYLNVNSYCELSGTPRFESERDRSILQLVDLLFGDDAAYALSSATEMSVPTPWHRDIFLKTPVFKMACYINSNPADQQGGELCVVPGSQHAGDLYADAIGGAVYWPESGGICPNPIFPMLKATDGSTTMDNYPTDNAQLNLFPYVKINAKNRDLVIFDQRLVHASTNYRTGKKRRMMLTSFAINPKSIESNSRYAFVGYKKEDAILELEKWFQLQLNESGTPSPYYHVFKSPEVVNLLGKKLDWFGKFKNMSEPLGEIVDSPMRDNLNNNRQFFMKNMHARNQPVWN